eukprot:12925703-Prorocentrum_lima.AAC.1
MQHLGFSLNLAPDTVELTCPSLGYDREKIQYNNNRHLVVDLTRLVRPPKQNGMNANNFATQETKRSHP